MVADLRRQGALADARGRRKVDQLRRQKAAPQRVQGLDARGQSPHIAGIVAFKIYADRQWYVGVKDGHVAVYQGLPTTILGIHLSHPVSETGISARAAERLAPYRELGGGYPRDSQQDADALVDTIRRDVERARRNSRHHKGGGG